MYEEDFEAAIDELPGDTDEPAFYGERADTDDEGTSYRKVVAPEITEAALDGQTVPDSGLVMEYDQEAMIDAYPRLEEHL